MNDQTEENLADNYLVEKVLKGDRNAFALIIKNTERLVAQIVFKMINTAEDRKDMAQDIYLKAFRSLPHFRFQSKLSTWIGHIAYNTCLNYLQKKKLVLPDDSCNESEPDEEMIYSKWSAASMNETESGVLQKERLKILNAAIEKLPPIYKTLITLYHNEELSYEEIAHITALPEGTLKSYLFRARKALKETLLATFKKEEL